MKDASARPKRKERGVTVYTIGSLFDGSGGFPLAAQQNGMEALWASEVNEFRVGVTRRHFPQMRHLGDVTKVRGDQVEAVDVVTFGSPCQDLSLAFKGERKGLEGKRSSLFYEAVRIITEMREATDGRYPRFGVWENVPGALSSNKGEDFRCVLEALAQVIDKDATVPVPPRGKWTTSGMVAGNGWSIAWRVLDAQHFGVAQRRRRIVLVADFGSERAADILFEREGVSGDLAEITEARASVTPDSRSGSETSGEQLTYGFKAGQGASAGSIGWQAEIAPTLIASTSGTQLAPTVCTVLHDKDVVNALTTRMGTAGVDFVDAANGHVVVHPTGKESDVWLAGTLVSSGAGLNRPAGMASEVDFLVPTTNYRVRRLTPREAERLQGFPDDWTAYGIDENGQIVRGSDSKRYQAMGDSIAIPVFSWLFKRIKRVLDEEATSACS